MIKERERCDRLENDIITQKHCIDLILQESITQSKINSDAIKKAASDESAVMKSEIKSLKSDLAAFMTKTEDNYLSKVKMEIEALQSAVDSEKGKSTHKVVKDKTLS